MAYEGSCHCGAVVFSVDTDIPAEAMSCNCSHCRRKGFLLAFVPAEQFTLKQGEDSLADYRFNAHKLAHRFCTTCGCQPFTEGQDKDGAGMRGINLRCVPECDLAGLKINAVDGKSF